MNHSGSHQDIIIFNGRLITSREILNDASVLIRNGIIEDVRVGTIVSSGAMEINAQGNYISPGFIDLHVHGGGGHDFMDNDLNGFLEIAKTHALHGTTSMYPTTLSCEKEDLLDTISLYETALKHNHEGSAFLGIHIEGPYLSMNQRGAQDPRYIRDFDEKEYKEIIALSSHIRRWSAAPELKGAIEFAEYMKVHDVLPAIAHTDAIYEDVMKTFEKGFTHVTHFYSCTSGVTRRNAIRFAGVIETAYLLDDMTVEIIADGVHLPAPLLKLIYKIKGADKIALITDAMRAASMPEGESILGSRKNGLKVIVEDGVAKLPDRSSFAGSIATADQLVKNMIQLAEVPLVDAIKMITLTPATIMGISNKKGSLDKGMDADVVIFDEAINIQLTMSEGRVIYRKS